jgi:hypothetical protein
MSSEGRNPPESLESPDHVRGLLRELRAETPAGEREFAARLHRRLVAAGAPPTASWVGRLAEGAREVWQELVGDHPQRRSLLTGAVLGALVTAVVFTLLSGSRATSEALVEPAPAQRSDAWGVPSSRPVLRPSMTEHKSHTAGDRRLTRDRMGTDMGAGAERPHTHEKR